jgi:hypothetical protein
MEQHDELQNLQQQVNRLESKIDLLLKQQEKPQETPLWLIFIYGFLSVAAMFLLPVLGVSVYQLFRNWFM